MSHHGREYEDDDKVYIEPSVEDSLRKAIVALGAKVGNTEYFVRVSAHLPNKTIVTGEGENVCIALGELVRKVATAGVPTPRKK